MKTPEEIAREIVEKYFGDPFDEDGSQRNELETLVTQRIQSAIRERDEKLMVAEKYMTHKKNCQRWRPTIGCDCGLDAF